MPVGSVGGQLASLSQAWVRASLLLGLQVPASILQRWFLLFSLNRELRG